MRVRCSEQSPALVGGMFHPPARLRGVPAVPVRSAGAAHRHTRTRAHDHTHIHPHSDAHSTAHKGKRRGACPTSVSPPGGAASQLLEEEAGRGCRQGGKRAWRCPGCLSPRGASGPGVTGQTWFTLKAGTTQRAGFETGFPFGPHTAPHRGGVRMAHESVQTPLP